MRLLLKLLEEGHTVYTLVRNPSRFIQPPNFENQIKVIKGDILDPLTLSDLPKDFDVAYYLIHSMSDDAINFDLKDRIAAENFLDILEGSSCKQVIYLSGIVNDENLSKHLNSRLEVEKILKTGPIPVTCLRAAIIIGAGSASFEIIRDLVEKLPIMVAPKWILSKCQPIAIFDVIDYLSKVVGKKECFGKSFDIGGPDIMTYKEMLLKFAELRKLKRYIMIVPVLTPKLSSKWLFFVTSTSYDLAKALVDSLKNDAICINQEIQNILPKKCLTYVEAIERAFQKIEDHQVISSWKDSWSASKFPDRYKDYIQIPKHGCLTYTAKKKIPEDLENIKIMKAFYQLGGKDGYYVNWAWKIRGFIDRLLGGVGLRRGKVSRAKPRPGDALDFWRVLLVDEEKFRFLLYAEMKLPGEAWLELSIEQEKGPRILTVQATFRPRGVFGRVYWYSLWPTHLIIFRGLVNSIIKKAHSIKSQDQTS